MSTATLTWTPPTTRTDGSSLPAADIASAQIYDLFTPQGNPAPPAQTQIGSVTGAVGTFTTATLGAGTHIFTVTTTDTNGDVSAPSNAVNLTVSVAAPSAITDLAATLNP